MCSATIDGFVLAASLIRTENSSPPWRATRVPVRGVAEAVGDLLEELVAGVVAEEVVDLLEAVQVDGEHRQATLDVAASARAPP